MRCQRDIRTFALPLGLLLLASVAWGQDRTVPLPASPNLPSTADLEAENAVVFFPATDALATTPASPEGFVAVSFPLGHPEDRSHPAAGVWTRAEVGPQTYWLEGNGLISTNPMQFDATPRATRKTEPRREILLSPMVRADTVIAEFGQASKDSVVRFYHFDSHLLESADPGGSGLQPEFVRQETQSQARSGILLPSGTAIAGLWAKEGISSLPSHGPASRWMGSND